MASESVINISGEQATTQVRPSTTIVVTEATQRTEFNLIPTESKCLLEVRSGVDSSCALSEAGALEASVLRMLRQSVDGSMDGDLAFLCAHALETATALRFASGASF